MALFSIILVLLMPVASVTAQPLGPSGSTYSVADGDDRVSHDYYTGSNGVDSSSTSLSIQDTMVNKGNNGSGGENGNKGGQGNNGGKKGNKSGNGDNGGENGNNGEENGNNGEEKGNNGEEKGNKGGNGNNGEVKGNNSGEKGNNGGEKGNSTSDKSGLAIGNSKEPGSPAWVAQKLQNSSGGPPFGKPGWVKNNSSSISFGNLTIDLDANASSLAHRKAVITTLQEAATNSSGGQGANAERYIETLNGTLQHVLDPNRITSVAVFRGDKQVIAPLSQQAPQVTNHLLTSEAKLARQSIDDAERIERTLNARNFSYNTVDVSSNISAAKRALEQAKHVRKRSQLGAVEQYRQAWTHAQRALDIMDEAVKPQVAINTTEDMPYNGTVNKTIAGTIFDIRPHELNATISKNSSKRLLDLSTSTRPGTTSTFNTTVQLRMEAPSNTLVYYVDVDVKDPGIDTADSGYSDDEKVDLHSPQNGTARVWFDGDGLPDSYESQVTNTSPKHPDSDSNRTAANETANGRVDGAEDFDDDSIPTYREYLITTDPFDPDSDGDGLTDDFEHDWPTVSPIHNDTDGDGRPDGEEDPDGDGLTNLAEVEWNTSILHNDTDRDGLSDSAEVDVHGTTPTNEDTDGDSLSDGEELNLGTDPLEPDTDGDGIIDGNETFKTKKVDQNTNVSIVAEGEGSVSKHIEVTEEPSYHNDTDARKGTVVHITNRTSFDSASVNIPLDNSTNESDYEHLSVFKYNRSSGIWNPIDSEIDPNNESAVATVNSMSYFTVFNETRWNELTTIEPKEGIPFDELNLQCEGVCSVEGTVLTMGSSANNTTAGSFTDVGDDLDRDRDDDGIPNSNDNCPDTPNKGQADSDDDGIGDACDPGGDDDDDDGGGDYTDSDNDSIPDSVDNCIYYPNPGQQDTDGDGTGNACDSDDDGDGISDSNDNCQFVVNVKQQDIDGDGKGAKCDPNEPVMASQQFHLELDSKPESITLEIPYEIDNVYAGYSPTIKVSGESGTPITEEIHSTEWDLEQIEVTKFKGQTVTVTIKRPESTVVNARPPRVLQDTDDDGIYDYIEEDGRFYPGLRDTWVDTDPNNKDTDGDGLADGEEVQYGVGYPNYLEPGYDIPDVHRIESVYAHPEFENTDGAGLNDSQEKDAGSNPREKETLVAGISTLTYTINGKPVDVELLNNKGVNVPVLDPDNDLDTQRDNFVIEPMDSEAVGDMGTTKVDVSFEVSAYIYTNDAGEQLLGKNSPQLEVSFENLGGSVDKILTQPNDKTLELGESRTLKYKIRLNQNFERGIDKTTVLDLADFSLSVTEVEDTPFDRSSSTNGKDNPKVSQRYSVRVGATMATNTLKEVEDVYDKYETGIQVSTAVTGAAGSATTTGEFARTVLYNYISSELGPPTSGSDLVQEVSANGVAAYVDYLEAEVNDIPIDANMRVSGPTIIRIN